MKLHNNVCYQLVNLLALDRRGGGFASADDKVSVGMGESSSTNRQVPEK